jgi:threonine synthase
MPTIDLPATIAMIRIKNMDELEESRKIDLQCLDCGYTQKGGERVQSICPSCGNNLIVSFFRSRRDLNRQMRLKWQDHLRGRENSIWRYRELLPVANPENIVSMGEGVTPLLHAKKLGAMLGLERLYIKDERQGPTGSFKDRQASVAISVMKERGITEFALASTGNVALAYAAYAARAGIKMWAFVVENIPDSKLREICLYGAEVLKVRGTYDQVKVIAANFAEEKGIFLDRGIKNMAGVAGMKTLAFELAEQLHWHSPDWYFQGVSGGMGPAGVAKGFEELKELGFVDKVPALGIIQPSGCAPMVIAFKAGEATAAPVLNPQTNILPLATGTPGQAYELLKGLVDSYGGTMEDASDEDAYATTRLIATTEGISVEPAAALAFAGMIKLASQGVIKPNEVVVVNCCGHTYPVEEHITEGSVVRTIIA